MNTPKLVSLISSRIGQPEAIRGGRSDTTAGLDFSQLLGERRTASAVAPRTQAPQRTENEASGGSGTQAGSRKAATQPTSSSSSQSTATSTPQHAAASSDRPSSADAARNTAPDAQPRSGPGEPADRSATADKSSEGPARAAATGSPAATQSASTEASATSADTPAATPDMTGTPAPTGAELAQAAAEAGLLHPAAGMAMPASTLGAVPANGAAVTPTMAAMGASAVLASTHAADISATPVQGQTAEPLPPGPAISIPTARPGSGIETPASAILATTPDADVPPASSTGQAQALGGAAAHAASVLATSSPTTAPGSYGIAVSLQASANGTLNDNPAAAPHTATHAPAALTAAAAATAASSAAAVSAADALGGDATLGAAALSLREFTAMVEAARATSGTSLAPDGSTRSLNTNTLGGAGMAASALNAAGSFSAAPGAATGAPFATQPFATGLAGGTPASGIAARVGSPQWPAEFGRQFISIAQANSGLGQVAELRLDPPELGPLRITINLNDNVAHAVFSSPHAAVRQSVENALPQLQQMLEQAGISLGQANVNDQQPGQAGHDEAGQASRQAGNDTASGVAVTAGASHDAATARASRPADPDALVDTFA